jgi:hypothetical protein
MQFKLTLSVLEPIFFTPQVATVIEPLFACMPRHGRERCPNSFWALTGAYPTTIASHPFVTTKAKQNNSGGFSRRKGLYDLMKSASIPSIIRINPPTPPREVCRFKHAFPSPL